MTPITIITFRTLGPSIATMAMASTIVGKLSRMSIERMITVSDNPR